MCEASRINLKCYINNLNQVANVRRPNRWRRDFRALFAQDVAVSATYATNEAGLIA